MVEPAFMGLGAVYVPSYDAISTRGDRIHGRHFGVSTRGPKVGKTTD
jgi:hypothetical protein